MSDTTPQHNVGTLVERLRSYESDMARIRGIRLESKSQPHEISTAFVAPEVKKEVQEAAQQYLRSKQIVTPKPVVAKMAQTPAPAPKPVDIPVPQRVSFEQPKNHTFAIILVGIFIIGGLIGTSIYMVKNRISAETPAPVTEKPTAPVVTPVTVPTVANTTSTVQKPSTLNQKTIIADSPTILDEINQEKTQTSGEANSFVSLIFTNEQTKKTLTITEFLDKLSPHLEPWFSRSLTQYYVALHNSPTGWQPVFVFKTNSYQTAYAGMLRWESTMGQDFAGVAATSTASFKDAVIKNHDVRVLVDAKGNRSVFYSFIGTSTIVITTNEASLGETFSRLDPSKVSQ